MNTTRTRLQAVALLAVAGLALAGCAATPAATDPSSTPAGDTAAADAVIFTGPWVKAAETGMSAAFGEIVNESGDDVTVVSVASPASTMLELHETVEDEAGQMVMREIEGGFVIPAGGSLLLEPGADHIMLMDLTAPLVAGEETTFTLTFSDDSEYEFTAPVKEFAGANENYEGGDMDHGDAEHGDADHGDAEHGDADHGDAEHGDADHGDMDH